VKISVMGAYIDKKVDNFNRTESESYLQSIKFRHLFSKNQIKSTPIHFWSMTAKDLNFHLDTLKNDISAINKKVFYCRLCTDIDDSSSLYTKAVF
jgi:hypothetical protein